MENDIKLEQGEQWIAHKRETLPTSGSKETDDVIIIVSSQTKVNKEGEKSAEKKS